MRSIDDPLRRMVNESVACYCGQSTAINEQCHSPKNPTKEVALFPLDYHCPHHTDLQSF